MLNFTEELEKFKPSMEIDEIEEALYREEAGAQEAQNAPEEYEQVSES